MNDFSSVKGRLDDFGDDLCPCGVVQQELRLVGHDALETRVQQNLPDSFRNLCAAGFPQLHHRIALFCEGVDKHVYLGGLAGTVDAF